MTFLAIGIFFYNRIMNRIKNGLVVRIHKADSTIDSYRYNKIPVNNEARITEVNSNGEESHFMYMIKEECIEKGTWGRYIDFDYHNMIPINPHLRDSKTTMKELVELFKLIGSVLETDLPVKLLRSSKFEDFVKAMLIVAIIGISLTLIVAGVGTFKTFMPSKSLSTCTLNLDNTTWRTLYIGSNTPPPSATPTATPTPPAR
jgi:hypothetical protein